MFDHRKFNFGALDLHCKRFAEDVVYKAIDFFREPTEFMFGDHVVDPDGYNDAILEEQEKMWDYPFQIPVEKSMLILDCVRNDVYSGCYYGRKFPAFDILEILFDTRVWGETITLNQLGRKFMYDDETEYDPKEDVGDYETLVERVAKNVKDACDKKLNEYFELINGADPA